MYSFHSKMQRFLWQKIFNNNGKFQIREYRISSDVTDSNDHYVLNYCEHRIKFK